MNDLGQEYHDRTRGEATFLPDEVEASKKSRKRKLPKIVSSDEASRVLVAAQRGVSFDPERGTRDRLMLELMYRAGLRVGELGKLRPQDIQRDGVIHLYAAKGGDGTAYFDPDSILPLLDRWYTIREQWIATRTTETPNAYPVFITQKGTTVTVRYVQRLVKRLKAECDVQGVLTPHVLRHTFATELIGEDFPIHEVQAALRHANIQTTAIYLHVRDESLRRKMTRRERTGGSA